jgi:DNA-binding transcriptional MerR regulator
MDDQTEALPALTAARDVAAVHNVTLRTLSNWERKGVLVPLRISGRRYYRSSDLLRLQEQTLWARIPRDL